MKFIKLTLKIKNSNELGEKLDITEKFDEIIESSNVFNEKYKDWHKRIIITNIAKKAISILLIYEKETDKKITLKELRLFIMYLRNIKNWSAYTKESQKMFECTECLELSNTKVNEIIDELEEKDKLNTYQINEINFLKNKISLNKKNRNREIIDNELSDDEIISIINYLLKTKNKGSNSAKKVNDINKITQILEEWI